MVERNERLDQTKIVLRFGEYLVINVKTEDDYRLKIIAGSGHFNPQLLDKIKRTEPSLIKGVILDLMIFYQENALRLRPRQEALIQGIIIQLADIVDLQSSPV